MLARETKEQEGLHAEQREHRGAKGRMAGEGKMGSSSIRLEGRVSKWFRGGHTLRGEAGNGDGGSCPGTNIYLILGAKEHM